MTPLAIVAALPSPGDLRGPEPATADAADLAEAFTGRDDPELAEVIDGRAPVGGRGPDVDLARRRHPDRRRRASGRRT